jgi:hypothetical protein
VATLVERWWNIPPVSTRETSLTWAYGGVGGGTRNISPRPSVNSDGATPVLARTDAEIRDNLYYEVGMSDLWLPAA